MGEETTLKLIMEKGPLEGETLEFKPGSVIRIGRVVRGNTMAVKDAGVSSKHLLIEFKSGKWVLTDLDSSNGTILNDSKLLPMNPSDLSSEDTIKIGEYTSIKVKIEVGDQSRLRRNPRRRAKDGELDAVVAVAEKRGRKGGAKTNLASVSENSELGFGVREELGENAVSKNQNQTGRPRRARVLKNEPQENLLEVEKVSEVNNAGPIEPKQGRQVNSRRTRSSKKEENSNSDSMLEKIHRKSGLDGNNCRESESSAPVEDVKGKRTRGGTRRKRNLEDEPLESVKNVVLKEDSMEGLNLQPEGCKEVESTAGVNENLPNGQSEAIQVDVLEDDEGVQDLNLRREGDEGLESVSGIKESGDVVSDEPERREGDEGLESVSGVKESGDVVGDEPDLGKMTLEEWFDYLEVYLPKQIHDATEEMISNMRYKAQQFHEFMLQQKTQKDKGKLPMG